MKRFLIFILLVIILTIRFFWYEETHSSQIPNDWFETKQTVQGIIVADPDRGLTRTRIVLENNKVGKLVVTLATGIMVDYGDELVVTGMIRKPESFETTAGRSFNYPKYLAVKDIYGTLRADTFEILGHDHGFFLWKALFDVKKYFVTKIKQLFSESPAALLAGIVVGEQSLFPQETLNNFQLAGLTHIIVLSGYNITLLLTFFITLFAHLGFGYRGRRIGAMIAIPLFIIMTGNGTSLLRAGIMALIATLLQVMTRPSYNFRILIITASVMVFHNPRILLYSPSFHLSFLAFIGLVYVVPIAQEKFKSVRPFFGFKDILVETSAIQLFVLPYILWMSGQVSLGSLLANILTVPVVPFLMFLGFFSILITVVIPPLGAPLVFVVEKGLNYVLWVAQSVAGMQFLLVTIPKFSHWLMIGLYGILAALLTKYYRNHDANDSKNLSEITNT